MDHKGLQRLIIARTETQNGSFGFFRAHSGSLIAFEGLLAQFGPKGLIRAN